MQTAPKCADHPHYKAIRTPRFTTKNPHGCKDCWDAYIATLPNKLPISFNKDLKEVIVMHETQLLKIDRDK